MFSPAIDRKLYTNDPPTEEEAVVVRKALAGSLERLECLEDKILHLRNKFHILSHEQRKLTAFVEGHRNVLSPARRLLPELLQEMFYHCLPTAHNSVMSIEEAPLVLGRVCSQWRCVAYSTPKLWASIHIVVPPFGDPPYHSDQAEKQAISAWLSRSGVLPLSISVCTLGIRKPHKESANNLVQPYLDLIIPHARRWKSVHLSLHFFDWTDFFNQLDSSDVPLLESLHIGGRYKVRSDPGPLDLSSPSRENGILQAPRLHAISLPFYFRRILGLRIRWKDLKALNLGTVNLPLRDVAQVLASCPDLEVCTVLVSTRYQTGNTTAGQMTELALPKLRTLGVISRCPWSDNIYRLFDNLATPALRHLLYDRVAYITRPRIETEAPINRLSSSIRSFIHKSSRPLEELDFSTTLSGESVVDILPLVPGLKRLSLRGYRGVIRGTQQTPPSGTPMDVILLARLTPNDLEDSETRGIPSFGAGDSLASECLCPKLEVFHCVGAAFSEDKLLEFLCSRSLDHRKYNVSHLRRVSISFERQESFDENRVDMKENIQMLKMETGMLVDLRYRAIRHHDQCPPSARSAVANVMALPGSQKKLGYFGF